MAKEKKATGDKKRYRNAGVTELVIEGKSINPDDEFEASLDPVYEMQMLAGGHLEILRDQSSAADQAEGTFPMESAEPEGGRRGRRG